MSALCQTRKYSGYSRRLKNELIDLANVCASARVFGHEGVMRRSGLLTAAFALTIGISGLVWSQCGTAAATRARLSPARVAEHLFAWHGRTGRGTEGA